MMTRLYPLAALAALTAPAPAADWPQWMGPNRDGVWAETGIVATLPDGGPKVLWRAPVGGGYAGPAVAGGRVYVTDKRPKGGADPKGKGPTVERVLCLDQKTGKELWAHAYDCAYTIDYPAGPRCTPTVSGGKVYALGAMGDLVCLDAATGAVAWHKNFPRDYGAKPPVWGFTGHPLVYKNLVVTLVGGDGSVAVAFDKGTGREVWKALSAPEPGYAPPSLVEAGGTTQLVVWTAAAVNGLNPDTGAVYWSEPLKPNFGMAVMAPRKDGDYLFAAGNGGAGAVLKLAADKPGVSVVWKEEAGPKGAKPKPRGLYPINMTPLVEGGVVYGVDQPGMLRAVDLLTGRKLWYTFDPVLGKEQEEDFKGGGTGTAFLVRNGDRHVAFNEAGELLILKLSPKGCAVVSRARVLEPTGAAFGRKVVWSHPAFAGRCAFARNDKELVCLDLAAE